MTEDTPFTPSSLNTESANGVRSTARSNVSKQRVALIGRAGAGKTSLARALFGAQNRPSVTDNIAHYQNDSISISVDDLPGWVNGSESSLSMLFSYLEDARATDASPAAVWYTLDAVSARVTDYELQLIRRIAHMYPVVIVLTRADLVSVESLAEMQSVLEAAAIPNNLGIVAVAAEPLPALAIAPYGVDEVLALTTEQDLGPSFDAPIHQDAAPERVAQPANQPEARPAPEQNRFDQRPTETQSPPLRDERVYERAGYGEAPTSVATAAAPSATLMAWLILASLGLLLLVLLGRRRRNATASRS